MSLSIWVVDQWNSIPANIVEAPTMKIFERRLDLCWKEHDLIHNFIGDVNYSPIANPLMETDDNASRVAVEELAI